MESRWVALDVGETLVDETRLWSIWADLYRVPRLTFMAALGAVVGRGGDHQDTFTVLGISDWRDRLDEVRAAYVGFREDDLYPDALVATEALRAAGYRVAILANQPAVRTAELRALGFQPDVMAMSEEMGVSKPDQAFFARSLELMGSSDPRIVAYVGDRIDNDVLPSGACGMRSVWIRRGPWGVIQELPAGVVPSLVVGSLTELVDRIDSAWG